MIDELLVNWALVVVWHDVREGGKVVAFGILYGELSE